MKSAQIALVCRVLILAGVDVLGLLARWRVEPCPTTCEHLQAV